MYVFGVDIPLVEIFFVLTIVSILILFLLIFITIEVIVTNRKLTKMLREEHKSISELDDIQKELKETKEETEKDMVLLENIRRELSIILGDESQEIKYLKEIKGMEGKVKKRVIERKINRDLKKHNIPIRKHSKIKIHHKKH